MQLNQLVTQFLILKYLCALATLRYFNRIVTSFATFSDLFRSIVIERVHVELISVFH